MLTPVKAVLICSSEYPTTVIFSEILRKYSQIEMSLIINFSTIEQIYHQVMIDK